MNLGVIFGIGLGAFVLWFFVTKGIPALRRKRGSTAVPPNIKNNE